MSGRDQQSVARSRAAMVGAILCGVVASALTGWGTVYLTSANRTSVPVATPAKPVEQDAELNEALEAIKSSILELEKRTARVGEKPSAKPVQLDLLNELSRGPDENAADIIKKIVSDSASQASSELGLNTEEASVLSQNINQLVDKFDSGQLSGSMLDQLLQNTRRANVPLAAKFAQLVPLIEKSNLDRDNKVRSLDTVRRLSKAIVSGDLPEENANELFSGLVIENDGDSATAAKCSNTRLLQWIDEANEELAHVGIHDKPQDLSDDLHALFEGLNTSPLPTN